MSEDGSSTSSIMESLTKKPQLYRQLTVAEARRNKRWMVSGACIILIGCFFFIVGVLVLFILYPIIFEAVVYNMVKLKPWTDAWEGFVETPMPIFMDFRFFHVVNAEPYMKGEAEKPEVLEIGPYAYLEGGHKKHLFMTDVDKVSYANYDEYYWNQTETDRLECRNVDGGGCSPDDEMTILNVVLAALPPLFIPKESDPPQVQAAKNFILSAWDEALTNPDVCEDCQEGLFITTTVAQFLFDGYEYKSLKALLFVVETLTDEAFHVARKTLAPIAQDYGIDMDKVYRARARRINGSPILSEERVEEEDYTIPIFSNATMGNAWYTINTGILEPGQMLNTIAYMGDTRLPESWWPDVPASPALSRNYSVSVCKDLYGTDGTQFPPFPDPSLRLWVFISDICRPLWLDYMEDAKIRDEIDAYRYGPPQAVFDMSNPENFCYCPEFGECAKASEDNPEEWDISGCTKCLDGLFRIFGCSSGLPIVMSSPHFVHGDPVLWEAIDGINPSYELHDTYLDVEIDTGIPLVAHKRIQVSVEMTCTDKLTALSHCSDLVFPVFWSDEAADIDDETYDFWMHDVERPYKIVLGCCIAAGMLLGAAIIGLGIWVCWKA